MALNIFEELDLSSSGDNVDEGFLKCKNNWEDTDTELYNARDGEASLLAKIDTLAPATGHFRRSKFTYADVNTITVGGGSYDVDGTLAKITSALTTVAHGLPGATPQWAYLYIDYSSLPSDNVLIQSDLIWSTTEPTWSHTKLGWYNGSDRCIFSCWINTDAEFIEFIHVGDLVLYADRIAVESTTAAATSYTDITALTMPSFSRSAPISVGWLYVDAECGLWWRTNGQSGSAGHFMTSVVTGSTYQSVHLTVITDSSHIIEVKESQASTNTFSLNQDGWYLPEGI